MIDVIAFDADDTLWRNGTLESLDAAEAGLQRTLELDPDHALAAAYLSDLTASSYHLGFHDDMAVLDRAEELGRREWPWIPNASPPVSRWPSCISSDSSAAWYGRNLH